MRLSSLFIAVVLALATPQLPVSPAHAWIQYAAPVIVSPVSQADPLTGMVTVAVTSEAPAVLVAISVDWFTKYTRVLTMSGGAGSFDWPTAGFVNPTITAFPCQTAEGGQCDGVFSQVQVSVDNMVDAFDAPTVPVSHAPAYDPPMSVLVTDDNPGSDLWVLHDRRPGFGARVGAVTPGVPTELTFAPDSYPTVSSGPLRIIRCSTLDPRFCAVASGNSADVKVLRALGVDVYASGAAIFSPNGDGVAETLPMGMGVDTDLTDAAATWTMLDESGTEVLPAPVSLDVTGLGAETDVAFTIDPLALGSSLSDGDYSVKVVLTGTVDGRSFSGAASTAVTVDTTAPAIVSAVPRVASFNPHYDDWSKPYRDVVVFSVSRSGPTPWSSRADVIDASGSVVARDIDYSWWSRGQVRWSGRARYGRVVPEGAYRIRLTARDYIGNESVVESSEVTLSHAAYESRKWEKTVSAADSLFANWSGRCGLLRKPGIRGGRGSLGYYSNGRCRTNDAAKGVAAAAHKVVLPSAEKYGPVRFRVNGGAVDATSRAGFLTISNKDQPLGRLQALSSTWGWQRQVRRQAKDMVWQDRAIYWMVNCGYGQRYDVAEFGVTLNYVVWTGPSGTAPYRSTPRQAPSTSPRVPAVLPPSGA